MNVEVQKPNGHSPGKLGALITIREDLIGDVNPLRMEFGIGRVFQMFVKLYLAKNMQKQIDCSCHEIPICYHLVQQNDHVIGKPIAHHWHNSWAFIFL
jgi:hypothetical protein